MKKMLRVILSAAIVVNLLGIAAGAVPVTPVVMVAGYSSTNLFMDADSDNRQLVWKPETEALLPELLNNSLSIIAGSLKANQFSLNPLAGLAGPFAAAVFEPLALDAQGNSLYNVSPYPTSVADTRYDKLKQLGGEFIPEYHCMQAISERVGDKNLYLCTLDWRQGQVDCAGVLAKYLADVRAATGSTKVDLMGISFGAGVIGTYLTLYEDMGIEDVVLNVPMLDGTSIATQLLAGDKLAIQYDELLSFMMELDRDESMKDLLFLADTVPLNMLDSTLREIVKTYLFDIFVHFGSVWDFVTADKYEAYKAKFLGDAKYAALVEKSDTYHYQVQGKFADTFERARAQGIDVFIVAGYGISLLTDGTTDSDGIIDRLCSTGAGAPGTGTAHCANESHYHISPDGTIDAATGFLPERTWFVDGLMHGQSYWDIASTWLIMTLLLGDEIDDVHTDDNYPQFMFTQNPGNMVKGAFNASKSGYITKYDTAYTVTNLSRLYDLTIQNITCKGADIRMDTNYTVKLQPGQSVSFAVHGTPPAADTICEIQIAYLRYAAKAPLLESRAMTHRFIAEEALFPAVLKSNADTSTVMDNAPAEVIRQVTGDYMLAKMIAVLQTLAAMLLKLFR